MRLTKNGWEIDCTAEEAKIILAIPTIPTPILATTDLIVDRMKRIHKRAKKYHKQGMPYSKALKKAANQKRNTNGGT